ncbi:Putative amidase AmiA2 [Mycobacteroides abscessus]|nr:Putative amidase AmiA2 [Mycobacteroides abscessus]
MSGFPTLTSQAAALSDGSESSVSLTLTALNAIKSSQSTLNAFRVVCTKTALAEAAEADKRLARGERLPLLGVPIAIKDDTDLAGLPPHSAPPGPSARSPRTPSWCADCARRVR